MGKLEQNQSHNIQALDSLKAQCVGVHMHMNSGFWLGTFFSFFNISCLACFILKSLCSYFCRHSVSKTGNEILSEIMKDAIKHCQEKKKQNYVSM